MPVEFSGGCACRNVRYDCGVPPQLSYTCHCRDCQRASGSVGYPMIYVPGRFLAVRGTCRYYGVEAASGRSISRGFCPECGSPLFVKLALWPNALGVTAGSLDDPSRFQPIADIWTESAHPWDTLRSPGPTFARIPTDEQFLALLAERGISPEF
jgi:hypothetical protein